MLRRRRPRPAVVVDIRQDGACFCRLGPGGAVLVDTVAWPEPAFYQREQLARLLAEKVRALNLAGSPCATLLRRPYYSLHLVDVPPVPEAELGAALRWQVADLLDFPVQEAVLDHFPLPAEAGSPPQLYVVAAREGVVQERVDLLRGLGLEPFHIGVADLALRNLSWLLEEPAGGLGLLCMGQASTLFAVMRGGDYLFGRALPVGRTHLVQAIGGTAEAAAYLERVGLLPWDDDGGTAGDEDRQAALRAAVEDLTLELQRSLDYYENRFRLGPVGHLRVLYEGNPISGLARGLSFLSGRPCADFPAVEALSPEGHCALAYGLALGMTS